MTYTAQALNTRVQFQQQTTQTDEAGQPFEAWTTYAEAFVRFDPLLGREYFSAVPVSEAKAKLTMRWRDDVKPQHRVVVRGQPWDIIDVQNIGYRNREALLYVRRIE